MPKVLKKKGDPKRSLTKDEKKALQKKLDETISTLADIREQQDFLTDSEKTLKSEVMDILETLGQDSRSSDVDGQRITVRRVQNKTFVIDEAKLRKQVGAKMWGKITTKVLDRKKMDAFVASGEIPISTVAKCGEEKPGTPHIRVERR